MKPLNRKNYGSIPHLSNSKLGKGDYYISSGQEKILTEKLRDKKDEVLVFEKYDGSNVGIAKLNDKIYALTRSGYEAKTSPYKQHHLFSEWVYRKDSIFKSMLKNGERITGEWMAQACGLIYEINTEPIVFFDLFNPKNERFLFDELKERTDRYYLTTPRLLHRGNSATTETLMTELNKRTELIKSIELPEGMVYRVERNNKVDFLAKWVRKDFPNGIFCIGVEEDKFIWQGNYRNNQYF